MYRRPLLAVGAFLGLSLAGCLGGPSGSDDDGTVDETTDPTTTDPVATDDTPAGPETGFEVLDVRTGDEAETASVTFDAETVDITGRIGGNNGCYTARLASVTTRDGTLVVAVESYEETAENRDCMQALVSIEYQATVTVDGTPPDSVTVRHNGDTVTTAARS